MGDSKHHPLAVTRADFEYIIYARFFTKYMYLYGLSLYLSQENGVLDRLSCPISHSWLRTCPRTQAFCLSLVGTTSLIRS